MAHFRVALGLVLISMIACMVQAIPADNYEQDGIKARGAKFGKVTVEESKEICKARCVATETCEFWTWYYPTANPIFAKRCSMYGGEINQKRTNGHAVTGSLEGVLNTLVDIDDEKIVPEVIPPPVVEPAPEPEPEQCVPSESSPCCSGMVIFGHDNRGFKGTTREACTQSCRDETRFTCRSADFNHTPGSRWCVLTEETHETVPNAYGEKANWSYCLVNKQCVPSESSPCCSGMVIFGYDNRGIKGTTREACTQSCRDETKFTCKSADFNHGSGFCVLTKETHETVPNAYGEKANWSYCLV